MGVTYVAVSSEFAMVPYRYSYCLKPSADMPSLIYLLSTGSGEQVMVLLKYIGTAVLTPRVAAGTNPVLS